MDAGHTARGASPPLLKHLNERTVLEAIRASAPISRAEISRRAGISKPTVSLALQSLLEAGLVREAQARPGGPELRRGLLRARARSGARARPRRRRTLPPRRDLRPLRRDPRPPGRRDPRRGRTRRARHDRAAPRRARDHDGLRRGADRRRGRRRARRRRRGKRPHQPGDQRARVSRATPSGRSCEGASRLP